MVGTQSIHPHASQVLISASIAQALPGLAQNVTDWREFKPAKLVIAPYPDTPYEFEVSTVRESDGRTVWTGRNSIQGAFLVTTATENDWHAVLSIPGASSFEFHISAQGITVKEQADDARCGAGGDLHFVSRSAQAQAAPTTTSAATMTDSAAAAQAATSTIYNIDVLFFYDAATLAANSNDTTAINNTIAARIEAANLALQNSGVNMRWNFITSYQVPDYTATYDMADDLRHIESMNMSRSRLIDPVGQFAYDKCVLHGADQAVLYVSGNRNYAGLAYTLDFSGNPYHYSVVLWQYDFSVVAHEMAHNFGCNHDRQTEASSMIAAHDGDGRYFYGHRFTYNGADTGEIMSYAGNRWPYFSNPDVTYNGVPMGVAEDQPRAANCARVLRDMAPTMANYRQSTVTTIAPPVITSIEMTIFQ